MVGGKPIQEIETNKSQTENVLNPILDFFRLKMSFSLAFLMPRKFDWKKQKIEMLAVTAF